MTDPLLRAERARVAVDHAAEVAELDVTSHGWLVVLAGADAVMDALLGRRVNAAGDPVDVELVSGQLSLCGHPLGQHVGPLGLAPLDPPLPPRWTVHQYLCWSARLLGGKRGDASVLADAALQRLQFGRHRAQRLSTLRRAERRVLQLAAAIVQQPQAVVCEQPLSGLDGPEQAYVLATMQHALEGRGGIVSIERLTHAGAVGHLLQLASDVVVMRNGKQLLHGTSGELLANARLFELTVHSRGNELCAALQQNDVQTEGGPEHFVVRLPATMEPRDVLRAAGQVGAAVTGLVPLVG